MEDKCDPGPQSPMLVPMGDDRRKKGKGTARQPTDHSGHAPTRAFKQMPTEVLDLPPPDPNKLVDPDAATRQTKMQNKVLEDEEDEPQAIPSEFYLDDEPSAPAHSARGSGSGGGGGEFDDPYGTEVLGAVDPDALGGPQGLGANVTEPEPFRPPALNSDMRALAEVAREPTAVHQVIDGDASDPEGTDTSADEALFESPTTGFDKVVTGESESPFSEHIATDEEGASDEPPAAPEPEPAPADELGGAYYEDIQGAFNSARVYDPKTAQNALLGHDAFAPRASADWPEISLEQPQPQPPASGGRSPFMLLVVFVAILFVTIGAMGAAFKLGLFSGGDTAPKPIWGDLADGPADGAEGAAGDAEGAAGDGTDDDGPDDDADTNAGEKAASGAGEKADEPPVPAPSRDDSWKAALAEAAAPALAGIDKAWRGKRVVVRLAHATDTSKAGFSGLDDDLALAFGKVIADDDHAGWRLRNRIRRRGGYDIDLELGQVQIASGTAETVVRARCSLKADGKRVAHSKLQRDVEVEQRISSATPGAPTADIARDIAKACGYRLAWDFIATALD